MRFLTSTLLAIALVTTATTSASAQAAKSTAPEIIITHDGADKVIADLKAILKLTPPNQQKQWGIIEKFLGAFLDGVDKKKPLRMDLVIPNAGPIEYQPSIPVNNIDAFRKMNLKPAGIGTRRIQNTLYQCKGKVYTGFLRYKFGYAIFAENKNQVPLGIADPALRIAALLKAYDAGMIAENAKTDAKSIVERRAWVKQQWKQLAAALKIKEGESKSDFDFRKTLFEMQMAEAERFYAESKNLTMGWTLDLLTMLGRGDLTLEAIPGTSLYDSIRLLGVKPSHFANITRSKDAILGVRINHPLDKLRRNNLVAIFKVIRDREIERVKTDKTRSAEEIDAGVKVIEAIAKILSANADQGLFDSFVDINPNAAKKHTAIMGFRTIDGRPAADVLKLLPKANNKHAVKMNVAKIGGVDIHEVTFEFGKNSLLSAVLGEKNLFIGVSQETLWVAGGANALKELQDAIKLTAAPPKTKPGDPFIELFIRFAPWVEAIAIAKPIATNPDLRKAARDAFKNGQDALLIELHRNPKDDKVIGRMDVQTDLIRFVGGMIAKFSEENLDDSSDKFKKKAAKAANSETVTP